MRNCSKCGRPLKDNEGKLCPACRSKKSNAWKRVLEVIGGVLSIIGVAVLTALGRRKS